MKVVELRSFMIGIVAVARAFSIVLVASYGSSTLAQDRVALVIGNSSYQTSPLVNPVNDAEDMARTLSALGFKVILRKDAGTREMRQAIREFGRELHGAQAGLFYFAGHGVQVKGSNYLVPIGTDIQSEADIEDLAIDADYVLRTMDDAQVEVNIVILDACRNNPFVSRFRSAKRGLAQMDAVRGSLVAFSTAPGSVASDGNGRNGVYTKHLLANLTAGDPDVLKVFQRTRASVVKETDGKQTPWESTSLVGDFYFRPDNRAAVEAARQKQFELEQAELRRAVDEERAKRERETEVSKQQLAQLQSELARLREGAPSARVPEPVETSPSTPTLAGAAKPDPKLNESLQSHPGVASTARTSTEGVLSSTTERPDRFDGDEKPGNELPPSLQALLDWRAEQGRPRAPPLPQTNGPQNQEWIDRIALLEKSRGQLTYSKALALLLNIRDEKELATLLESEQTLRRMAWPSAFAMGQETSGYLTWGANRYKAALDFASNDDSVAKEAVAQCQIKRAGTLCKVIVANGVFNESAFLELAKQFGMHAQVEWGGTIADWRNAYLRSLTQLDRRF
jgi:uncharacterized caspase-like protein